MGPGGVRLLVCDRRSRLGPPLRQRWPHVDNSGKERGPRKRPPVPVTSGGLAEALSCLDPNGRPGEAGPTSPGRLPSGCLRIVGEVARDASSPTLARRFPVGPGDAPLPAGTSTARTRNLHSRTTSFPRLARRISFVREVALEDDGELEAAVEGHGHRLERGVGLPSLDVAAEGLGV